MDHLVLVRIVYLLQLLHVAPLLQMLLAEDTLAPGYTLSRGQSLAPAVSFSIPPPPPLSPLESFPSVIPTSPNSVNHYTPNGWNITMYNSNANTQQFYSYVICTK